MKSREIAPVQLPSISIVVPNYNGDRYLVECLDSIISQGYTRLELLVIDGGSSDRSPEIIKSFGSSVSLFISEPDNGQSDAINKGVLRCTGDVVAYVNSDDLLEPGSLDQVGRFFAENPRADWLAGSCRVFGEGIEPYCLKPEGWNHLVETVLPWSRPQRYVFPQSGACFMRRELMTRLGLFDTTLHYSMDMEYYARAAFAGTSMHIVPELLAAWRFHPGAKTWTRGCTYAFRKDEVAILQRYVDRLPEAEQTVARQMLAQEAQNVLLREANYWTSEGERGRGMGMLLKLAASSPRWVLRRPWMGGVRRAMFGWQA